MEEHVVEGERAAAHDDGEGVDDDEQGMVAGDGFCKDGEVIGKGERPVVEGDALNVEGFDGVEEQDPGRVAARGLQAGFEDGGRAGLWGDEDDFALLAGGARPAGGCRWRRRPPG